MADVALLTKGSVSITPPPQGRIKGELGMGVMTLYALSIILIFLDPECAMKALFQPLFNIIMAGETLIGLKKFRKFFPHIIRVWVEVPLGNAPVTVLTGGLPVHGNMVSGLIDQPRCLNPLGAQTKSNDDQPPYPHTLENPAHIKQTGCTPPCGILTVPRGTVG